MDFTVGILLGTFLLSIRTISTRCTDQFGRFQTCASPTSEPMRYCSHPSRMEGGRTPFNGAGWMQASVKSLSMHGQTGYATRR